MPIKIPPNRIVFLSALFLMLRSYFATFTNKPRMRAANRHLQKMATSGDKVTSLPNNPEVLIQSTARFNSRKYLLSFIIDYIDSLFQKWRHGLPHIFQNYQLTIFIGMFTIF